MAPDYLIYIVNSEEDLKDLLDSHTRSLPCDYIRRHVISVNYKSSEENRILWQMKDIACDNVPFSIEANHVLNCSYGGPINTKKNSNQQLTSKCIARISIRKIKRYIDFGIPPGSSLRARKVSLNKLKKCLKCKNNSEIKVEEHYRLHLPLNHNHDFDPKLRLMSRLVTDRIRDLVDSEVTSSAQIKEILEDHVKTTFLNSVVPPLATDEAYFPSQRRIKDAVYNYRKRKREPDQSLEPACKRVANVPSGRVFKPSTLEDVVRAFCVDDIGDESFQTDRSGEQNQQLRTQIERKLMNLKKELITVRNPQLLTNINNDLDTMINSLTNNKLKMENSRSDKTDDLINIYYPVASELVETCDPNIVLSSQNNNDDFSLLKADVVSPSKSVFLKGDLGSPPKSVVLEADISPPPKSVFLKVDAGPASKSVFLEADICHPPKSVLLKADVGPPSKSVVLEANIGHPPKSVFLNGNVDPPVSQSVFVLNASQGLNFNGADSSVLTELVPMTIS